MTRTLDSAPAASAASALVLRQDARTIGLIGLAHGSSHFFHLLLPPLFPWLIAEFGYSYSQLSLLVTLFFVISGVGQALSGFLVDKVGARPILFAALSSFALAGVIASTAQSFEFLLLAAFFAGLGNAPFHPVDFTILNKRVSPARLGHGFSVHGISGNLGWALAPLFMAGISTVTGSWRLACLCGGILALIVLAIMVWNRDALDDRAASANVVKKVQTSTPNEHPMAFMRLPSVWLCFSFFFWTTCSLSAIQTFASPALQTIYGLPVSLTAFVVTGYMLCGAMGMVIGGFLVTRVQRLEKIITVCMLSSATLLFLVGTGWFPGLAAMALAVIAGLGNGLAGPSRDMLIKKAAPEGATGRVYGTVYSGLDLGFCVAAPVFGALLDRGYANSVFYVSGLAMALGVVSAGVVGIGVAARNRRTAAVA